MISEDNDDNIEDTEFIQHIFHQRCEPLQQIDSSEENYIFHIVPKERDSKGNIAVSYSNGYINLYKLSKTGLLKTKTLDIAESIVDTDFSRQDENLLFVAKSHGQINVHDLRTEAIVQEFKDTSITSPDVRNLTCLAVSPLTNLLCAGTEIYKGDAFILFWDTRKAKYLGGYWESHQDDITQVKFSSYDANKLASGSIDGLINIYDLSQSSEEDAFIESFNTQSSVENILWYEDKKEESVCCTTHTADIQLWNVETGNLSGTFSRKKLSEIIQKKSESYCYVASTYKNCLDQVYLLIGSNYENDECIRALKLKENNKLEPAFLLPNNKQIVRCTWNNPQGNLLITGGEKGIINVWNL